MDISKMTIGEMQMRLAEADELRKIFNMPIPTTTQVEPFWTIGKSYFIRTVTYHAVGRLVALTPQEFVLEDAAWVADSGRYNEFLKSGDPGEVEPVPNGLMAVGRGAFVDAVVWAHPPLRVVK